MDTNLVVDWWWTIWFYILFTFSQLLNLNPCCKIRATKCLQRTTALYRTNCLSYSHFAQKPWTICVIEIRDSFFSRDMSNLLYDYDTVFLQCEWINILLRTPSIWFLLDLNALRFSLHLAKSVVREIQKTKRSVIVPVLSSCCSESQI